MLELYRARGFNPKLQSGTNGGEYAGPCPVCGGSGGQTGSAGRFRVWPEQRDSRGNPTGSYWCRECEIAGDVIQFLMDVEKLPFPEAARECGVEVQARPRERMRRPQLHEHIRDRQAKTNQAPGDLWRAKAGKFVQWCAAQLCGYPDVIDWLSKRGIDEVTAKTFRLGWNPGETTYGTFRDRKAWGVPPAYKEDGSEKKLWLPHGLVIPVFSGDELLRVRIRQPEGEPKYYRVPSDSGWSGPLVTNLERKAFVIVEAELDALAIHAAAGDLVGAVAVGSASGKPDAETEAALHQALEIQVALDMDEAGNKAWVWWRDTFDRVERLEIPGGHKDPGDLAKAGGNLRAWLIAHLALGVTLGPLAPEEKRRGEGVLPQQEEAVEDVQPEARERRPLYVMPDRPCDDWLLPCMVAGQCVGHVYWDGKLGSAVQVPAGPCPWRERLVKIWQREPGWFQDKRRE